MDQPDLAFNPPAFRAIILMADAVQVNDGKLFILGGGLGVIGPRPQHVSVAVRIAVPWDQANVKHQWRLDLTNEDGHAVTVRDKPISLNGQFEAGRPAGIAPGSELWVPLGINFGALPLPRGQRFVWRLFINDETSDSWTASFSVRPG
ncbi:MAG: hypothetical protein R8J94_13450 [Acidimicrobiia bacterium]|nr:hypothetical protein [Acidimicrobiia bacterium]